MSREWFYISDNEEHGPVSEDELLVLFDGGRLHRDTMLWFEGLGDWTRAEECAEFLPIERMRARETSPEAGLGSFVVEGEQKRPWVRYFARQVDYLVLGLGGGCCVGALMPRFLETPSMYQGMLLMTAFVPFEALALATFGTTPGKWVFGTRVRKKDGSRVSFMEAFGRSLDVFVRGVGLGIPLIALFAMVLAYSKLDKMGETSWDARGDFVVQHSRLGALNYLAIALALFGLVAIVVLAASAPQ